MPIGNPATLPEFWDTLKIRSARFALTSAVVSSRTEGGDTITARRGSRLWQAPVALAAADFRTAEATRARLAAMADAGQTFLAYPLPVFSTEHDQAGTLDTATIDTLPANGVEIRLGGLAPGYTVRGGEFLSFQYGSSPLRRALHQVVSGTFVAASDGRTAAMEVRPAIRPGATIGASVRLFKPRMAAVIVPGSIGWGASEGAATSGITFEIIQTLRG